MSGVPIKFQLWYDFIPSSSPSPIYFFRPLPSYVCSRISVTSTRGSRLEFTAGLSDFCLTARGLSSLDGAYGVGSRRGRRWAARYSPNGLVQRPRQFGCSGFRFSLPWVACGGLVDVGGEFLAAVVVVLSNAVDGDSIGLGFGFSFGLCFYCCIWTSMRFGVCAVYCFI
ncbi:hypothetical protein RHGRI_025228 [Rhododendron griersonianum]|uniref:Uncharacterized protein n=1 Tax=Rhododendron griersonianum TaxID=479676 RepID=A0AAV6JHP3_9ERIC|nr:hypothetical protein RHGRI_025228 [Rhododendron griersonianum]